MRIGIDLDGVLAEFIGPFLNFENQRYDTSVKREEVRNYDLTTVLRISHGQLAQELNDFYNTPAFYHLLPIVGAQSATEELAKHHQLYVITSRPSEIHRATKEWLEREYPARFHSVHFSLDYLPDAISGRKDDLCRDLGINVMIDDSLEYLNRCGAYVQQTILFNQPWNRQGDISSSLLQVDSWEEIIQIVNTSQP